MNAPLAPAISGKGIPGFDLRKLCEGSLQGDGSCKDLPSVDAQPLPAINDLPSLEYGLDMVADQMVMLTPRDVRVPLAALAVDGLTGHFYRTDRPGERKRVAYTATALTHLCYFWNSKLPSSKQLPRSPGANLLWYPPEARCPMVDAIRARLKTPDRLVTARFITPAGMTPIMRAVVSDVHTGEHGDMKAVAEYLQKKIRAGVFTGAQLDDARLFASWSWDTATMTVYFGADTTGVRAVARLGLSETKAHSWGASSGVHMAGRTYWGWEPAVGASGRHVGNMVAERMGSAVIGAVSLRDEILRALDAAEAMPLTQPALDRLFGHYALPATARVRLDQFTTTATLRTAIDRLYEIENTSQAIEADDREELRRTLGVVLRFLAMGAF